MRTHSAGLLVTLALLTAAGCAGDEEPVLGEPPPAPTSVVGTGASAQPEQFVLVVREQLPDVASGRTDEEIALIAETACDGLASGTPSDAVAAAAQSLGTLDAEANDPATARELVKLAVDTVCLDQAARVDEF